MRKHWWLCRMGRTHLDLLFKKIIGIKGRNGETDWEAVAIRMEGDAGGFTVSSVGGGGNGKSWMSLKFT